MKFSISKKHVPLLTTALVALILYSAAGWAYERFFSVRVFLDFFKGNAVLGVAALGLTLVILSGGIDLSVGAMVGFSSILLGVLIESKGVPPLLAILIALMIGALFGAGMGALIQLYDMPPFLVTLGGMFLARGLAFVLRLESIQLDDPFYLKIPDAALPLPGGHELTVPAMLFIAWFFLTAYLAQYTRFGRNVYALGGNETSAVLMGLPVAKTKISVYVWSGFCGALAGVVYTFDTFSGNPTAGTGLELDAIAAVVIGGTLLTGGVGYVSGTLLGVLIFGIIQTAISFQGTLSSWWTRIAIGFLLLIFILLQKAIQARKA